MTAKASISRAPTPETPIANIAAYKFVHLDNLPARRVALQELCRTLDLKGTILIAKEGINLFLSAPNERMVEFVEQLREDAAFADLTVKWSYSDEVAFNRMLVKIKKEIIAFGVAGIEPENYTSPRILPAELKQWFQEQREFVLLDTRNEFEYEIGTFHGAKQLNIESFREFPEQIKSLPEEWKEKPIVTFCTGGIRCEKAAPLLEQAGFQNVLQLDGGILKYFEDVGGEFYDGECFVFDRRVAVDPELNEADTSICFACQHPLTPEERNSPEYEEGVTCPYCSERFKQQALEQMAANERELRDLAATQPGQGPYDHERPLNMPGRVDGATLIDALIEIFPHDDREVWIERIERGWIVPNGTPPNRIDSPTSVAGDEDKEHDSEAQVSNAQDAVTPEMPIRGGQEFKHLEKSLCEPKINPDIRLIAEDECWLAIDKPAPLPVHACGRYYRHTLDWLLSRVYRGQKLRPAHRLDANTSGLQVFCKSRSVSRFVQAQFEAGTVEKTYLVRVANWTASSGIGESHQVTVDQPIGDASGPAGVRCIDPNGKPSVTHFIPLSLNDDGTALLLARPETGRTNQIRVHLWHLGSPVLGDPIYLAEGKVGASQTLSADDPPMMLHAWKLGLVHPRTKQCLSLKTAPPAWIEPAELDSIGERQGNDKDTMPTKS